MAKKGPITVFLHDQMNDQNPPIPVEIKALGGQIWIKVQGYGEMTAKDGEGIPICIEVYDGELRILAWNDIHSEKPVIISMLGAKES